MWLVDSKDAGATICRRACGGKAQVKPSYECTGFIVPVFDVAILVETPIIVDKVVWGQVPSVWSCPGGIRVPAKWEQDR